MKLIEVAGYRIFHTKLLRVCSKCISSFNDEGFRIKAAKRRDAGSVEARLVSEIGGRRRFSPRNVGVRFRFILEGGCC